MPVFKVVVRITLALVVFVGVWMLRSGSAKSPQVKGVANSGADVETKGLSEPEVGDILCPPGEERWPRPGADTLVIVTDPKCTFCSIERPFHDKLYADAESQGLAALYVVGRTKDQDERLKELTKQRRNVWRARAAELSIFRTPTLILADPSGKIRARWVGSVPPDLERDVLSNLMAGRSYPRYRTTTRDEFVKSRVAHPDAQILALRDPKKVSPLEGARYIPFDEFGVRVEYELKRDKPVYVDCQGTDNFTCQRALTQLNKLAFTDVIGIGLPKHRRSCEAK